jgi:hypothetical protein
MKSNIIGPMLRSFSDPAPYESSGGVGCKTKLKQLDLLLAMTNTTRKLLFRGTVSSISYEPK